MKRALVVEDNEAIRKLLVACVAFIGKFEEVDDAMSAEEALEMFEPGKYSLAVIDIALVHMNGVDLGLKFRETDDKIILMAISGYTSIFESCDPSIAGFDYFCPKPVGYKEFLKMLAVITKDTE